MSFYTEFLEVELELRSIAPEVQKLEERRQELEQRLTPRNGKIIVMTDEEVLSLQVEHRDIGEKLAFRTAQINEAKATFDGFLNLNDDLGVRDGTRKLLRLLKEEKFDLVFKESFKSSKEAGEFYVFWCSGVLISFADVKGAVWTFNLLTQVELSKSLNEANCDFLRVGNHSFSAKDSMGKGKDYIAYSTTKYAGLRARLNAVRMLGSVCENWVMYQYVYLLNPEEIEKPMNGRGPIRLSNSKIDRMPYRVREALKIITAEQ